jgi:hypothetical protein
MAQRELTDRLNQHSQRTGPLLGCGMGLALVICMVTGMVLYQRLDEYRADIFGVPTVVQSVPTVPPAGTARATSRPGSAATVAAGRPAEPTAEPTPAPEATPTPQVVRYRVVRTSGENLNMRAAANTQAQILVRLPPNAIVDDAGEQASGPAGAQTVTWRKVKAPGGQVGWVPEQYLDKVEGTGG